MADFHSAPEWQQDADRHSNLNDAVLKVRPVARFEFATRRPLTAIDHALVFVTAKGAYDVFLPPHRPTRADAASRRYTSVYEVDTGNHGVHLEIELPSADDAFTFPATADLTWRVADPVGYVTSGERNVPERLARELQQCARPVSRRFSIEDSAAAEEAVQQAVTAAGLAAAAGLHVTCMVRTRTDDAGLAHRERLRELRYEAELLNPQQELRLRQAQAQHEWEVLRQQQMQELADRKIAFYRFHLEHGGVSAWALHLSEHPEDTRLVVNGLRGEELEVIKSQLALLASDRLEDHDKPDVARQVLERINDVLPPKALAPASESPAPADTSALAEPSPGTADTGWRPAGFPPGTDGRESSGHPDETRSRRPPIPPPPSFPPAAAPSPDRVEDRPRQHAPSTTQVHSPEKEAAGVRADDHA